MQGLYRKVSAGILSFFSENPKRGIAIFREFLNASIFLVNSNEVHAKIKIFCRYNFFEKINGC